jgi:hypothetical protein
MALLKCCGAEKGCRHKPGCRFHKLPPYSLTILVPNGRWKIVHRTPDEDTVERVYFVSLNGRLTCSCPAFRYGKGKPCKHCRFVANLIGRPELAESIPADADF